MLQLKWSVICICGLLLLVQYAPAQNLLANPGFETTSADPNLVCANWTRTSANAAGVTAVTQLAGGGLNGSASLHLAAGSTVGGTSTANGAWQIIGPLQVGASYRVQGKWRGKMSLNTTAGAQCTLEARCGFGASPTTRATTDVALFGKREQNGSTNRWNMDPNSSWDWTEFSLSPEMGYDGGSFITATNTYMTIRFVMNTTNQLGDENVDIDNVTVDACQAVIGASDINNDCVVNFKDLAVITGNWLGCTVAPSTICW